MNETIEKLISALTEAVHKLNDKSTGEAIESDPKNAFRSTPEQTKSKDNKILAKQIAEANREEAEEARKSKGRTIAKEILPISIVSIDKKALNALADIIPVTTNKVKEQAKPKEKTSGFGMTLLKGLAYTAFAAIVGPVMFLFGFFEEISKQKWFIKLKKFIKGKFWEPIKKFFKPVGDFFSKIKNSKFIKSITTKIDDIWTGLKKFGGRVKSFMKPIARMFNLVGKLFGGGASGGGIFSKIAGFFNPAKNPIIKGIMSFAKGLGTVLGKIFLPLTIIMEAFNFITGFMDGYEEGGVMGGLEQGVTDVFNSLIGWPLDMLKSGLSWILGAFGFEDAEKALDSFSFQDMFSEMFDRVFANIGHFFGRFTKLFDAFFGEGEGIDWAGAMESVIGIFKGIPAFIGDMIKDGLSMVLGMFGFDGASEWLDSFSFQDILDKIIGSLVSGFMSVIDWVGLLFTEPSKAFKKISDWFDKLLEDPVGTIKEMLPQWMTDFGGWIYDIAIKPLADFFGGVADDPATAKKNMLSYLPEWMTGFAGWVFDNYIMPIVNYFDKLLSGDIVGAFAALVPPWLKEFGGWLYDNTIGKIMQFFDGVKNNSEGMKQNFLAMLPSWMTGFGTWIWDNAIKPIADFFNSLFDDPAGTLKSLIPEWVLDVAGWLYDNALAPIVDWFGTLFDDPAAAFAAMIPDWVKDVGGWIGGHFSEIWDNMVAIFEPLLNFDFSSLVPDWIKDWMGDDFEAEKAKAEAEKTGKMLAKAGVSGDAAAAVAQAKKASMEGRGNVDAQESVADEYEERIRKSVGDKKAMSANQIDLLAEALAADSDAQNTKLGKEVLKLTGGSFDHTSSEHKAILARHMKKMYDSEMVGDDVDDDYDESIEALSKAAGKQVAKRRVDIDTVKALVESIRKVGGVKLGAEMYRLDGTSAVTGGMLKQLEYIYKQSDADIEILKKAYTKLNITPAALKSKMEPTEGEEPQPTGPVAMDFISRPGQDPLFFDKGDIVMGLHRDVKPPVPAQSSGASDESTRQLVNNSKELVARMDSMVTIMNQHSEIHGRILEVLSEAGLVDKQGNTVVNNGGNSSVTNNVTQQSNIMNFRDQVIGRMNNSSTKYT